MATEYVVQNRRPLTSYPWYIPDCFNRNIASQILESCQSIQNGNFLVRPSQNKQAKYTITLWFNNTTTHVRINELDNGQYQLDFKPNALSMPTFSSVEELIDFYTKHNIKLVGHCEGLVKLKFNSNILDGGVVSYAS